MEKILFWRRKFSTTLSLNLSAVYLCFHNVGFKQFFDEKIKVWIIFTNSVKFKVSWFALHLIYKQNPDQTKVLCTVAIKQNVCKFKTIVNFSEMPFFTSVQLYQFIVFMIIILLLFQCIQTTSHIKCMFVFIKYKFVFLFTELLLKIFFYVCNIKKQ